MSSIWQIFKPAKHKPEIEDSQVVKDQYKYWRWRIFYSMYIGYAFYYFTRKSFTFAMPTMMSDLGFDESQLGFLGTVMSLTYGVSKFTSGVLADRSNPRLFMSVGLFITGVMNICFGLSSSLTLFALFWGLNGWFQGWGWPPCARLLTHWYSQKERGTWWGGWNTSHNVGGFIIAFLAAYCAQIWGWRAAMYAPGIICIIVSFFLYNRLR
ncbi:MAG: MFS transporter, partial [Chlamydiota bacterium]